MTHERIEQGLRSELPADEAHYVARPLPATVAEARASVGRPKTASRPAVMVAMAGLVAVGLVAAVVGWTVLQAAQSERGGTGTGELPSETASPPPTASPAGIAGCRGMDFAVASDPWDSAAGSRGTVVVFRVVDSTSSCMLPRELTGRITDASGAVLVTGTSPAMPEDSVAAGTQLEVGMSWSNWCGTQPVEPLTLEIRMAGDDAWIPMIPPVGSTVLVPPCIGDGQATALNLTGFQPSDRAPIEG
jgi:hypothetical protein